MSRLNIIGKPNRTGQLRLLFSYSCIDRRYFATGVTIPKEDFQSQKMEKPVRASNPNASHFNHTISLLYHEIQQIISTLRREDKIPAADLVFKLHQDKRKEELVPLVEKTSEEMFREFMEQQEYSQPTARLYETMWSQLWECFPKFKFEEFTIDHWMRFRKYLKTVFGHSNNTMVIRLNKLKATVKYLKKQGYQIPITSFPLPKEEVKKISMDLKDLQKVMDFIPQDKKYQEIKDHVIIQCHTALRISDLKRISRHHFLEIEGAWFIHTKAYKTDEALMIPLDKGIMDLFRKYDFQMVQFSEAYYNIEIKKLLYLAGVTTIFEWKFYDKNGKKLINKRPLHEIFTNHCCSRTAIAYFFSLGYAPDQVCRIVGKSMDTIMEYYYQKASSDDIVMRAKQFRVLNSQSLDKA